MTILWGSCASWVACRGAEVWWRREGSSAGGEIRGEGVQGVNRAGAGDERVVSEKWVGARGCGVEHTVYLAGWV